MAQTFHLYDMQQRTYASETVFQVLYTSHTTNYSRESSLHVTERAAGETDAVLPGYLLLCTTYI